MKIVFLSFYSGIVARGVETFVHEVANRLQDFGHEVLVYQNGPKLSDSRYKTVFIDIKVNWQTKSSQAPLRNYFALKIKEFTKKVLASIDHDTNIIFPTNGQWQSILCSLWAKTHRKKVVISGQSGPGRDDKINIYTFPNVFFGLTDFQSLWAKRINPLARVEKVSNGVDTKKFSRKGKAISFDLPRPIILSVAALDDWKRLDLAIKAVARLKNGSLVLVGKGKEKEKLNKMGRKLLPGRFKILSFEHKDMPAVYRNADLFTFPTVSWESFGIVLVEAMASGLPIVATNDPIRKEIVGNAGILVDPTDTTSYAKALQKALSTDWGNKPRTQAEKFDWDIIAKKYEEIFKTL